MSQRLKSWESPRHEGRNDKGKGGSARQRQKKKQLQMLRKKLKAGINQKGYSPRAISFLINASPQEPVEQNRCRRLHENQSHQISHSQTCNA